MSEDKLHFIIIDDSKLDCFIAEKIIRNTGRSADIKSYTVAREALEYIKSTEPQTDTKTVVLVDIQMPIMNGFEFVEAFEQLPRELRNNYVLYMLSSSINENDLNKVRSFASIKQFLNKPLTSNMLSTLLEL